MAELTILAAYDAPGRGPAGLAWDGRFLWNADYTTGSIYQLDPQTMQVQRSILCPGNLSGLAWDGRTLWQSLHDAGWIRQVNPATNDFDHTVHLDNEGWISGVAWENDHLWAVSQQFGKLLAVNPADSAILRTLPAPVAAGDLDFHNGYLWLGLAYPMQFDPIYQGFDWVGDEQHFALLQIDPADGAEIARYPLTFMPMGVAWAGDTLWLSHAGGRKLYQLAMSR
ncbi:MAG: hypothetical protein H6662_18255 [Ardenticatenaceae bacterium]|nr:hypothetical protein [Anaerolineales bacterium]MCB8923534.1 hypothetical protein [Ardenticatenaceae bacterium]MCB8991895.1 hypothetical protein [Ardenticatenaceae bacterium]MCB9003741.1 hypothetical protein [Ardenticatenaceae bacterium]